MQKPSTSVTGSVNKFNLNHTIKPAEVLYNTSYNASYNEPHNALHGKHKAKHGGVQSSTPMTQDTIHINPDYKKTELRNIKPGDYIRYFDTTGTWRPGGTVDKIDRAILHLSTTAIRTKKQHAWTVRVAEIADIYIFDKAASELRKAQKAAQQKLNQPLITQTATQATNPSTNLSTTQATTQATNPSTNSSTTQQAATMELVGLNVLSGTAEVDLLRRSLQGKIDELTARVDRQHSLIVELYRVLQQHELIKMG
jgi:hypothetical protein